MIGVTAATSAGVYIQPRYIDPGLAMPVMLGVLAGSMHGAHVLVRAQSRMLRIVFSLVIVLLGIEMIYNGVTGKFYLRHFSAILAGAMDLHSRGLIQVFGPSRAGSDAGDTSGGLVFAFARQRDRVYLTVSLVVLAVLVYSLVGAGVPG